MQKYPIFKVTGSNCDRQMPVTTSTCPVLGLVTLVKQRRLHSRLSAQPISVPFLMTCRKVLACWLVMNVSRGMAGS
jgi:hypothetical protein